jgi:hypothetical protein
MKRVLAALALLATPAINIASPDVSEIVRQSVVANHRNLAASLDFDHCERVLTHDGTKTYAVTMMVGTPYQRLLEINGQPLSNEDKQREQQKQDAARFARERETPGERTTRLEKHEKDRRRNRLLLDQLPLAFDYSIEGEQTIGRYDAYVLHATPKRDYQPPTLEAQVLMGMDVSGSSATPFNGSRPRRQWCVPSQSCRFSRASSPARNSRSSNHPWVPTSGCPRTSRCALAAAFSSC